MIQAVGWWVDMVAGQNAERLVSEHGASMEQLRCELTAQIADARNRFLMALLSRWRLESAYKCLAQWQSWCHTRIARRRLLMKALRRMRQAKLSSVLHRWMAFEEESRQGVAVALQVTAHMRSSQVTRALNRWTEFWKQRRRAHLIGLRL